MSRAGLLALLLVSGALTVPAASGGAAQPVRDTGPAWSPDGRWLAFTRGVSLDREPDVYAVPATGGRPVRVSRRAFAPAWSRSGVLALVRFVRCRDQKVPCESRAFGRNIFRAQEDVYVVSRPLAGTRPRPLTRSPIDEESPAWSPDGKRIAFVRIRHVRREGGPVRREPDVFVMTADATRARRLTFNAAPELGLSWSPDGRRIVFARLLSAPPRESQFDLFVVNRDGTNQRRLTRTPEDGEATPAWSPDGRRIAFTEHAHGGTPHIVVMNADGTGHRELREGTHPAWSPNGKTIAYTHVSARGGSQIYVMNADGSRPRPLLRSR